MVANRGMYVSVTEYAALGLLREGPRHGFALAKEFTPGHALGRIWSVRPSLVYRSLKTLQDKGLVEAVATESTQQGPSRTVLRSTADGNGMLRTWLDTPVTHFREVRVELMLKLALIDRGGGDWRPLLRRQRDFFRELSAFVQASNPAELSGFDRLLTQWRGESARATMRFLDLALDAPDQSLAIRRSGTSR